MKNNIILKNLLLVISILLIVKLSYAQDADSDNVGNLDESEIINLEGVYKNNPPPVQKDSDAKTDAVANENKSKKDDQPDAKKVVVQELKDLNKLAPFREVSVIQKKYMPKSNRVQFYLGLSYLTNTPWYNNYGGKLGVAYHFTENWSFEVTGQFMTSSKSKAVQEIHDNNNLDAEQFVYTKSYLGGDIVWSPIYGKMTSLDNTIIPFEMYFALGGGSSSTNSKEGQNSTIHFGLGQIFSLGKSMAFRWDYSFNSFQATPQTTSGSSSNSGNYSDLILSAGISFFVPEVSSR